MKSLFFHSSSVTADTESKPSPTHFSSHTGHHCPGYYYIALLLHTPFLHKKPHPTIKFRILKGCVRMCVCVERANDIILSQTIAAY